MSLSVCINWPYYKGQTQTARQFHYEFSAGCTCIFGPSGAGKSSIASIITGHKTPISGQISRDSQYLFNSQTQINIAANSRKIGYIPQAPSLFPHLTLKQNIMIATQQLSQQEHNQLNAAIDQLQIRDHLDKYPHQISGGQSKRATLLRSLAAHPSILVMDEPFEGIDKATAKLMINVISQYKQQGMQFIIISHQPDHILALADQVLLMHDGHICEHGTAEAVLNSQATHRIYGQTYGGTILHATQKHNRLWLGPHEIFAEQYPFVHEQDIPLQVLSHDVSLSTQRLLTSSIRNQLPAMVTHIERRDHDCLVTLSVNGTKQSLTSLITLSALDHLSLTVGSAIYAYIKAVAVKLP